MATIAPFDYRERYANTAVLYYLVVTNTSQDESRYLTLPAGFGEAFILDAYIEAGPIATILATYFETGPSLMVTVGESALGARNDFVGVARWVRKAGVAAGLYVGAVICPDSPVLWTPEETLHFECEEIDTSGAPTAELRAWVRVERLRTPPRQRNDRVQLTS